MGDTILYSARQLRNGSLRLAKWDGHKEPVEFYDITNGGKGKCNCFGAYRHGTCKHKELVARWFEETTTEPPFAGEFYDYDHKVLYTPLDNEGVQINGVVTLAHASGK